jgi:hypothetical protein
VSPGIIAGATIAGVALLSVLAFLIWFFGFHRKKVAAQQQSQEQAYPPQTWQQPETRQVYEVDGKGAPVYEVGGKGAPVYEVDGKGASVSQKYGYGYAPVQQNTYEVSELPGDQRVGK